MEVAMGDATVLRLILLGVVLLCFGGSGALIWRYSRDRRLEERLARKSIIDTGEVIDEVTDRMEEIVHGPTTQRSETRPIGFHP
jgi:hypothetical protein